MITLSGSVSGKVVWSRSNALIYKTKIDYDYQGTMTTEGRELPISIQLKIIPGFDKPFVKAFSVVQSLPLPPQELMAKDGAFLRTLSREAICLSICMNGKARVRPMDIL